MKNKTFTQLKQDAKTALNSLKLNELIFNDDNRYYTILEFIELHPSFGEKTSLGLRGFTKIKQGEWGNNNYSLAIIDSNDQLISISLSFNKSGNEKSNVLKAFRTAVYPEIAKKKKEFIENETLCEISGEIIGAYNNLHIDHHELDFKDIVAKFLKRECISLTDLKINKIGTTYHIAGDWFRNEFIDMHNANTTLRFTHKYYNLRK